MRIYFQFLLAFLVLSNTLFSQGVSHTNKSGVSLFMSSIQNDDILNSKTIWLFKNGDNAEWAKANFDDKTWDSLSSPILCSDLLDTKFNGNVWLRTKFIIDDSIVNKAITFSIIQSGASEVYIDGKLVKSYGKIGKSIATEELYNPMGFPLKMEFDSLGYHTIAIRYSNYFLVDNNNSIPSKQSAIYIELSKIDYESGLIIFYFKTVGLTSLNAFGLGIFLTFAIINLVLFLFYKNDKSNLYFSLFCFMMAISPLIYLLNSWFFDPRSMHWAHSFKIILSYLVYIFLILLVYLINYESKPKRFWIYIICMSISSIALFINYSIGEILNIILGLVVLIDVLILCIRAFFRKYDKRKKIRKFLLYALIGLVVLAIVMAFINPTVSIIILVVLVLLIALPIAGVSLLVPIYMVLKQARNFSFINKNLQDQLTQVKELSEKSIQQELEKQKIIAEQNEFLEKQVKERTNELAQKNVEITDSINYASRIQKAMLTSQDEIDLNIKNNFILFKPKDIVSGDFYFYDKQQKLICIAAVDCTGHGVPGSLMSMIGHEKLISSIQDTYKPSKILQNLNRGVKKTLRQSGNNESTRDGMDIALTVIDTETQSIYYSGANRPLWLIRNNTNQIEEFKATKKAIGGFTDDDQLFEETEIKLEINDTFYLFSDGFADQFGKTGKKLMTKKFKEVLLSIQHLTMKEQKNYLDTFMEDWKFGIEQLDDILVIGVRF